MRQRARFAIDERTTTYDERLEKHVIGYARDSRGPPVMAAPTADCELPTAGRRLWRPLPPAALFMVFFVVVIVVVIAATAFLGDFVEDDAENVGVTSF